MRAGRAALAAVLALSLAVPAGAAAVSGEKAAGRRQDLELMYQTMAEHHPNLFANTPQASFLERIAEIEGTLAETDDLTFALDLQSLAALAGDSHTTTNLNSVLSAGHMFPVGLTWLDGEWIVSAVDAAHEDALGQAVAAVNGFSMDQVQERMALLLSADNPVKLRRQVGQVFGQEEMMAYCGLAQAGEPLELTLEGRDTLSLEALPMDSREEWPEIASLSALRAGSAPTEYRRGTYYFALPLDGDTYYIQYNQCAEDPELSMEDFTAQVAAGLAAGNYRRVLLDLRNNGGGSDGVIMPLLMELAPRVRSGELELWGLVGEATFSSASINAMEIREMGGFLAGEPTSGSVDHFGSTGSFALPNSGVRVSLSTKNIDLETLLECAMGLGVESIQPDVTVYQTLEDYLAGRDTLVEALSARQEAYVPAEQPGAPLSRGRFAEELRRAAGKAGLDTAAEIRPLSDLIPCAWYAPGVYWALERGVSGGTGEYEFQAARPITRQEAAVMLYQTARLLGGAEPDGAVPLADETDIAPWALQAVRWVVASGRMAAEDGAFRPNDQLTRAEGAALAAGLSGAAGHSNTDRPTAAFLGRGGNPS